MPLKKPVAVYNAANNVESHLVCNMLNDAGIEAHATDDVSQVGTWMFGLLPEIHKPQIWIDQSDIDRARPILDDYERRALELQKANQSKLTADETPIEVKCEECGRLCRFPAAQRGTVQECPQCSAYVDVEDSSESEEWWNAPEGADDANHAE